MACLLGDEQDVCTRSAPLQSASWVEVRHAHGPAANRLPLVPPHSPLLSPGQAGVYVTSLPAALWSSFSL